MLLKNRRIFIVEDNAAYVAIASNYLRYAGAIVESESWGLKVPGIILKHLPIDVILLDLMLPRNASGFDVFDQIRAVPELAAIPIIAVSAADPEVVMPQARERGFAGFISKPISASIVKHVAAVLEGKNVWKTDSWQYWSNA
jgi:two-component system cell cycle response regulator DivK